jgi:predicted metal-dependent hydrolase
MFWKLIRRRAIPRIAEAAEPLRIGDRSVPLLLVHNPKARRYLLRLKPDGTARITIPRGGNVTHAHQFAQHGRPWLEQQLQRLLSWPATPAIWTSATEVWFRGEQVRLEIEQAGHVRLGSEIIRVKDASADLRPTVEAHLRKLASREFPPRVRELALLHGLTVQRVSVRNQRSRWGSCSRRGTISLNWRLIQTPEFVRDYIILHELAHLRHMNHSRHFWQEVERLCPDYLAAERWLKTHRLSLR